MERTLGLRNGLKLAWNSLQQAPPEVQTVHMGIKGYIMLIEQVTDPAQMDGLVQPFAHFFQQAQGAMRTCQAQDLPDSPIEHPGLSFSPKALIVHHRSSGQAFHEAVVWYGLGYMAEALFPGGPYREAFQNICAEARKQGAGGVIDAMEQECPTGPRAGGAERGGGEGLAQEEEIIQSVLQKWEETMGLMNQAVEQKRMRPERMINVLIRMVGQMAQQPGTPPMVGQLMQVLAPMAGGQAAVPQQQQQSMQGLMQFIQQGMQSLPQPGRAAPGLD